MRPESPAYLWDAREAALRITQFVEGKAFADYDTDLLLQSAVERQFTIIGEALNRLHTVDPEVAASVPDLPQIVGFRNILVHGYAEVQNHRVWDTAARQLAGLIDTLNVLLEAYE